MQSLWLMVLASHIAAAAVWWWVMPGAPAALLLAVVLAATLVVRGRLSEVLLPPTRAAGQVFWLAFAISSRIIFFDSFQSLWLLPFVGGVVLAVLWGTRFRFRVRPLWPVPLLAALAALFGWVLPGTQRAPDPATAPAG